MTRERAGAAALRRLAMVAVIALTVAACGSADGADDTVRMEPTERRQPSDDDGRVVVRPEQEETASTEAMPEESSGTEAATEPVEDRRGAEARESEPRQPPGDVEFRDYGENAFVDTDEDSLSTFAVDVDTGSYTLMRQWIEEGLIPPPESVRPEEYVNFFDSGHGAPSDDTFAVFADGGPTPFTDRAGDVLLRLTIEGREVSNRQRPDVNLTFVVDVSGSMERDRRLELVKGSLDVLVDELDPADRVSIVAYDDRAWVVLDPTPVDARRDIGAAISELRPGGSTNAEAGLLLGFDLAEEMYDADAVNKVVLLSDGVANVGEAGPEGLLDRVGRSVDRGIGLVTIGVGLGNYNDVLMEQLADGADGSYHYVDTLDEAERVFSTQLTGTLVTIAKDAKIQVDFDPDTVAWYRLVGFENREVADSDFRNDRVDGGEIGAGHSVTALYQIEVNRDARGRDRLATVSVRWQEPDGRGADEVSGELTVDMLDDRWQQTDPHFRLAATAAAYAEALREGRYADAYDLWDVADEVDELRRELDDGDVDELARLVEDAARLAGDR